MFFCCPGGGRKHRTKEDLINSASGFGASGPGAIVTTSRDVVAANRGIAPSQDIAATNRIQSNRSASSRDRIAANGGQAKVQQDDVSVISSAANSVDREHRVMAKRMVARSAAPPARPVTPPRPDQSRPITDVFGRGIEGRGRSTPSEEGQGSVASAATSAPEKIAPLPSDSIFTNRKKPQPQHWLKRDGNDIRSSFDEDNDGVGIARRRLGNALAGSWPVGEFGPLGRPGHVGSVDEDEVSQRPEWMNVAGSVAGKESVRHGWMEEPDYVMARSVTEESVRPSWMEKNSSVMEGPIGRDHWVNDPQSVDVGGESSRWPVGAGGETPRSIRGKWTGGETPRSVRPGWVDQDPTGSAYEPFDGPDGGRGDEGEDGRSAFAPSVRPGWMEQDATGSVMARSPVAIAHQERRNEGESDGDQSDAGQSDHDDGGRSTFAPSVRPTWMNQSETPKSVRPGDNDQPVVFGNFDDDSVRFSREDGESVRFGRDEEDIESVGFGKIGNDQSGGYTGPQQQPFWERPESEVAGSVRPNWIEGAVRTVGGVYRMDDDDTRSRRPTWMDGPILPSPGKLAPSPRSHDEKNHRPDEMGDCEKDVSYGANETPGVPVGAKAGPGGGDGTLGGGKGCGGGFTAVATAMRDDEPPVRSKILPAPIKCGPGRDACLKGEEALRQTSPAGTIAGQSSSQDAARPESELSDPVEGQSKLGLLKLLDETDKKEAERRRAEKERSLERFRGRVVSLPDHRDQEAQKVLRHRQVLQQKQAPQQNSAEEPAAKGMKMHRSETLPVSVGVSSAITPNTTARRSRKDKPRSSTPGAMPPRRASPALAPCGSSGISQMSPAVTRGWGSVDKGSPATPMTTRNSPGPYASSPSPGVATSQHLTVTNPYGGSSPSTAGKVTDGVVVPGGRGGGARRGDRMEVNGRSPSPGVRVMTPSSKGKGPSAGNNLAMRGSKPSSGRMTASPVVMVSTSSTSTVADTTLVMARGDVYHQGGHAHGKVGGGGGQGAEQHVTNGAGSAGAAAGRRGKEGGVGVVRFSGVGSISSEESAVFGKRDPADFDGRASHMSPGRVPGSIIESSSPDNASAPTVVIAATITPDKRRDSAAAKRNGAINNSNNSSSSNDNTTTNNGSKSKTSTAASLSSRIFSRDGRSRMSSGSSSASSGDGRKNSDGTPLREGRYGEGGGARTKNRDPSGHLKSNKPRSPEEAEKMGHATGPPPNGAQLSAPPLKMWSSKDKEPAREAAVLTAAATVVEASPPAVGGGGKVLKGFRARLSSSSSSQPRAERAEQGEPSSQLPAKPGQNQAQGRGQGQGRRQGRGQGRGRGKYGGGVGAGQASPRVEITSLTKTPGPWPSRGRQSRPQLGTPGQRMPSRTRVMRIASDLASVDEEPNAGSPVNMPQARRRNSMDSLRSDDSLTPRGTTAGSLFESDFAGQAQDNAPDSGPSTAMAAARTELEQATSRTLHDSRGESGGKWSHGPEDEKAANSSDNSSGNTSANAVATVSSADEKEELGVKWLKERSKRPAVLRVDSLRRSMRVSRSSSMDDGSGGSFGPRAMFSPDRFNAFAGALSRGGSVDDSLCDSSVRSFMTTGTRNSSSSLVSGRGLSDRKLIAPQLSKTEKQTVARLKIKRGDVHFGYLTVRGSARVYKAELNGEVCAAKVLNILGMSKEAQADVFETFDAELLALSQLNTTSTNVVKIHGASVSPAEIVVVSEFVEGGVLRQLLDNRSKQRDLNDKMRLVIAMDVAAGMKSLYAHGMQHRKLTSSAILLTGDYRAKIVGVGLSMTTEMIAFFLGQDNNEEHEEEGLPWASREVLAGAGFSEKSDVYSFGIILWEMMQKDGSMPYAGLTPNEVVGAKYNGEGPAIPPHCAPAIRNLMESCWSNLPADRPSFDKICDILEEISLGGSDKKKSTPTSRTARGSASTFAGAMSVP